MKPNWYGRFDFGVNQTYRKTHSSFGFLLTIPPLAKGVTSSGLFVGHEHQEVTSLGSQPTLYSIQQTRHFLSLIPNFHINGIRLSSQSVGIAAYLSQSSIVFLGRWVTSWMLRAVIYYLGRTKVFRNGNNFCPLEKKLEVRFSKWIRLHLVTLWTSWCSLHLKIWIYGAR